MDAPHNSWYFSDTMNEHANHRPVQGQPSQAIPIWHLYGEANAFPDVMHIEKITDRAAGLDWKIAAHRHPHLHQFFLLLDGGARITMDGAVHTDKPPFLLNVPAGVVHGFDFAAGTSGWVLTVPVQTLPELLDPAATQDTALGQAGFCGLSEPLIALFAKIEGEHGASRPARNIMLRALVAELVCLILRELDRGTGIGAGQLDPRFQRFLGLVDQHLRDGWRLGDYAREIGLSERHLSRICRSATGRPAVQLIEAATIREACRLLVYTRASVASIGYGLGFEDPSYFSRAFRRVMGRSPQAYRAGFEGEAR